MWIAVVLFFVLSPGLFITIPGSFLQTVCIHTVIFAASLLLIRFIFKGVRIEGFQDAHVEGWTLGNSCGEEYCKAPKYYCKRNESDVKYCSEDE